MVSSIGGNASTNAGGPHCLKYGITVNHVLGLEVVTGAGELVRLGGKAHERPGLRPHRASSWARRARSASSPAVTVRLLHVPEGVKTLLASFAAIEDASEAVSAIIARRHHPGRARDDRRGRSIRAIDEGVGRRLSQGRGRRAADRAGRPRARRSRPRPARIEAICRDHAGARDPGGRSDEAERALLWKGRKEAAGVVGRLTPNWLLQDAVVPRSQLPEIMREIAAIGARHRLVIANVFHAGDGNLHPMICYDDRVPGELERAKQANEELLRACLALGGSVTGEHGVGLDKARACRCSSRDADLNFMARLRRVFDPDGDHESRQAPALASRPAARASGPPRARLPAGTWI